MRVLQINSVCGVGSTGRIATDIHDLLQKQGHQSFIAYGRGEARNCDTAIRIGTQIDNYTHLLTTRLFDNHGQGSLKATRGFIEKVREINPDIIHLHNIHGYYLNIKLLFKYLYESQKPVVWTLHDCWPFTGHCAYFDYVGCERWKFGCFQCPQKRKYPSSLFLDNSKLNYENKKSIICDYNNITFVTPSNWLSDIVKESFLSDFPVKVIHNGIDTNIFKPVKSPVFRKKYCLEDKFIVLGVANIWDERKGLKYFHELSLMLDDNEVIVLIGLSDAQMKGLPSNIIGISRTNDLQDLIEIYSDSDVFINPTLEDNFPTTNIEALACGTPVITFNTGGSVESIDETCGFIINKGDIKDLKEKIDFIKIRGKSEYSNSCVKQVKAFFNKNDNYMKYLDLFYVLLNK